MAPLLARLWPGVDARFDQPAVMFHDALGNVLDRQTYRLRPGVAATFNYRLPDGDILGADGSVRVGIIPCVIPNPLGGRALPTAELVDSESGRTLVYTGR